MRRWMIGSTGLTVIVAVLGCDKNAAPTPQSKFNVSPDAALAPVTISPAVLDKSVLGAAASADAPPPAAAGDSTPVAIDTSTGEATMTGVVQMVNDSNFTGVEQLFVPEQREFLTQLAAGAQPMLTARTQLIAKLDEQFPGHAIQLNPPGISGGPLLNLAAQMSLVEVQPVTDSEGMAILLIDGNESRMTLRLVDGAWLVVDADPPLMASQSALLGMAEAMQSMTAAYEAVSARLDAGQLADAQTVQQAFDEEMKTVLSAPDVQAKVQAFQAAFPYRGAGIDAGGSSGDSVEQQHFRAWLASPAMTPADRQQVATACQNGPFDAWDAVAPKYNAARQAAGLALIDDASKAQMAIVMMNFCEDVNANAPAQAAPAQPNAAQRQRQPKRDAVDDVYSGPGMLRRGPGGS